MKTTISKSPHLNKAKFKETKEADKRLDSPPIKSASFNNQNWWDNEEKWFGVIIKDNPNQLLAYAQSLACRKQRDKELQKLLDWIDNNVEFTYSKIVKNNNGIVECILYRDIRNKIEEVLNDKQ